MAGRQDLSDVLLEQDGRDQDERDQDELGEDAGAVIVDPSLASRIAPWSESRPQSALESVAVEIPATASDLRALAIQLIMLEDRHRHRLSTSLHDGLQQILVAMHMRLSSLESRTVEQGSKHEIKLLIELVKRSLEASRGLTADLSVSDVDEAGLCRGLEWLAGHMAQQRNLRVELHVDPAAEPREPEMKRFLFHAARELLVNVAEHADSSEATLSLRRVGPDDQNLVEVAVEDNGRGFARDQDLFTTADLSSTLAVLGQRASWLGGRLEIDTRPTQGSRVAVRIAVDPSSTGEPVTAEMVAAHLGGIAGQPSLTTERQAKIRVLLVDDHEIMREGLARLLEQTPDIHVVGQADDGPSAIELVQELHPDVVTMDLSLPTMSGVEATQIIAAQSPNVRIIGLSMHDREHLAEAMRKAGAVAFLGKAGPPEGLIAAIRKSMGRERHVNPGPRTH